MRKSKTYISRPKLSSHEDAHIFLGFEETHDSFDDKSFKPVTKIIKKRSRSHKRSYTNIPNGLRRDLVEAVHQHGESIKDAARRLGINYSCAKAICQVYKREGRSEKKIPRNNGFKDQLTQGLHQAHLFEGLEVNQQEAQNNKKECLEISKNEFLTSPIKQPQKQITEMTVSDESLTIEEPFYFESMQKLSVSLNESHEQTQHRLQNSVFSKNSHLYQDSQLNSLYNFNCDLGPYKPASLNSWPFGLEKQAANFLPLGLNYQNFFYYSQPQASVVNQPAIHMMNDMKLFQPMYYVVPQNVPHQVGYNGYMYAAKHYI